MNILVFGFIFYSNYKIYGSIFFLRFKDPQTSTYYVLLFIFIALVLLFELFALVSLKNMDNLVKRADISTTINSAIVEMLRESTIEEKIRIAAGTFIKLLPVENVGFVILGKEESTSSISKRQETKNFLQKPFSPNLAI